MTTEAKATETKIKSAKPKSVKAKSKQKGKVKNKMFVELDRVLDQISRDKNIPKPKLIEAIEHAFLSAARKKWGHLGELEAHYSEENGEIELFQFKTVTDDITDPNTQMTLKAAQALDPDVQEGDSIGVKMDSSEFGRIAAQAAKQVIITKVRDAERDLIYNEYKDRVGELVTGTVRRYEKGDLIIDLGRSEASIPRTEQVPTEHYKMGERVQAYFVEINPHARGSMIVLSRRHPNLVRKLFEMEAPEVSDNTVEIKSVAREPGVRAKIAVTSKDSDVDPVGACVGVKGSRVQSVVQELRGEKIDIVMWDEDPARFVCNAIAPAEVVKVIIKERERSMEVVVPDDQLSLAIGRKGQNVRLAAQLSGWNIDVYSETRVQEQSNRCKAILVKVLGIDDSNAIILYAHGFRNFEDIAHIDWEKFKEVPGVGAEKLKEIKEAAEKAVKEGQSTHALMAVLQVQDEERKAKERAEKEEKEAGEAKTARELAEAAFSKPKEETQEETKRESGEEIKAEEETKEEETKKETNG
ncbi:MAG: transcription termination factor NusA [Deltaproteobacteria bacterium]|nr:transcription termination factor NusA [Deltaproteobacteria bacterium]MDZ4224294.1 transcription termination factor NusA [bacterium]